MTTNDEIGFAPSLAGKRRLVVTRASEIPLRRIEWGWTEHGPRFPAGELSIVAGLPGRGKSTKVNQLAARMTLGRLSGKFEGQPHSVIVSASEESWETTIAPKLHASGADLSRVLRVDALVEVGLEGEGRTVTVGLNVSADLSELEELMRKEEVGMVVFDPIISRLGRLDTHKDAEVRVALDPLVGVLHRTGIVGVGIMHFNKGDGHALKLLMGSTAFGAVARSVHVVDSDPDNLGELLLATVKANLGPTDESGLPMLKFRLEEREVITEDGPTNVAVAVDLGKDTSGRTYADVQRRARADARAESRAERGVRTAQDEAVEFLIEWMRSHNYSTPSDAVKKAARDRELSESSLHAARRRVGVRVGAREGYGGPTSWYWLEEDLRKWEARKRHRFAGDD